MKNLILYIIIIFFHIAVNVICQQYVPKARCLSTATLVGEKIFFFGGLTSDKTNDTNAEILKDFFYLNLSKPFTSEPLSFVDLSDETSDMTPFFGAATAVFGEKNESIFLFGGNTRNPTDRSNNAYSYSTIESLPEWKIVTVTSGNTPLTKRMLARAVTDNSGKIYIFGGGYVNTTDPTVYYSDEIDIFDTKNQVWTLPNYDSGVSGLVKRDGHTATFVPDRGIVYIGGVTYADGGIKFVIMDNLDVYDTVNATWTKWATLNPPEQRYGHTAVLTSDGRMIIFGGAKTDMTLPVDNRYVVLNTKTSAWLPGTGDISLRAPFKHHTATIYNDTYMFIAFGVLPGNSVSNNVVIYQIEDGANFKEFQFSPTPPASPSHEPNSSNRKSIIIGATLGSILGIVTVLGFIGLIIFRKYKKAYPIVVQTP